MACIAKRKSHTMWAVPLNDTDIPHYMRGIHMEMCRSLNANLGQME